MEKEQIYDIIKSTLSKRTDIMFAYIFGSFAANMDTPLSDIDIAIFHKGKKSAYEYRMIEFEIENQLLQVLPYKKFDVRSLNDAPVTVTGKILNDGKLLFFRDEKFYYDYLVTQRILYMDYILIYNPLFNERYENLLNDR